MSAHTYDLKMPCQPSDARFLPGGASSQHCKATQRLAPLCPATCELTPTPPCSATHHRESYRLLCVAAPALQQGRANLRSPPPPVRRQTVIYISFQPGHICRIHSALLTYGDRQVTTSAICSPEPRLGGEMSTPPARATGGARRRQ